MIKGGGAEGARRIERLRRGQEQILKAVARIQALPRSHAPSEPLLAALGQCLLTHWGEQDEEFFQSLAGRHAARPDRVKILEFLALDLREQKIRYLAMSEEFEQPGPAGPARRRELREFLRGVIERLNMEEDYLIPLLRTESDPGAE